jgi:hypothetical protein
MFQSYTWIIRLRIKTVGYVKGKKCLLSYTRAMRYHNLVFIHTEVSFKVFLQQILLCVQNTREYTQKYPISYYKQQFSIEFKNNNYYDLILLKTIYCIFYLLLHFHFNYTIPIQQGRLFQNKNYTLNELPERFYRIQEVESEHQMQ